MADIDVKGLADSILASMKEGAGDFLDQHQDAKDFVTDRAKRAAELTADLAKAVATGDDAERKRIRELMAVVEQSVRNELSRVALDASVASRAQFEAAVKSVFAFAVKALPALLAAL